MNRFDEFLVGYEPGDLDEVRTVQVVGTDFFGVVGGGGKGGGGRGGGLVGGGGGGGWGVSLPAGRRGPA